MRITSKRPTTSCWCDEAPDFDPDEAFIDGTGFVCAVCQGNVYFTDQGAN